LIKKQVIAPALAAAIPALKNMPGPQPVIDLFKGAQSSNAASTPMTTPMISGAPGAISVNPEPKNQLLGALGGNVATPTSLGPKVDPSLMPVFDPWGGGAPQPSASQQALEAFYQKRLKQDMKYIQDSGQGWMEATSRPRPQPLRRPTTTKK